MTIRRILVLFFVICALAQQARPDDFQDLYARLAYHGFENLRISMAADSGMAIAFENRVYRHDLKAVGEILRLVNESDSTWQRIYLLPCTRGVPRGQITVDGDAYRGFMAGAMDEKSFAKTLVVGEASEQPRTPVLAWKNRSFLRVDANITIGHQIQLGQYDDRLKLYGEFIPGLRSTLWHGTMVQMDGYIPFHDEISVYDAGPRIGRISVSQLLRLPADIYASLQFGAFPPERWGLSAETARFWLQRRLLTGAQLDNTGFFYHDEGTWFYSKMHLWTYKIYAQYFLPWTDMMLGLNYSKYLKGDRGWRVTMRRTFAETDIALYYAVTDQDRFGGVQLMIPLPTQRRMRPGAVRLTWPNQYSTGYRATSKATTDRSEGLMQTGLAVDSGLSLAEMVKYLTPAHVISSIAGWREGAEQAD